MKQLVIVGASGLAKEVYFIVKEINKRGKTWDFLGFVDKENRGKEIIDEYSVIGDDEFVVNEFKDISIAIAQGFPDTRRRLYEFYKEFDVFDFPNLIYPGVIGDFENIQVGEANIVAPNTVLSTGIEIGSCNLINTSATVGHDVRVGDFCVINPGATISGNVTIRDMCLVGANSTIFQGLMLAVGTKLGLGSALTMNTLENATYVGSPAKRRL